MVKWFKQLDDILRGSATEMPVLAQGRIDIPMGGLSIVIVLLGVIYGLCMGTFAMIRRRGGVHAADRQCSEISDIGCSHYVGYLPLALRI